MSEPPPPPAYGEVNQGYGAGNPPYPPATSNPPYPPNDPAYPPQNQPIYNTKPGVSQQPPPPTVPHTIVTGAPQVQYTGATVAPVVVTQPAATTTVVVSNANYRTNVYRTFPIEMNCPHCREHMSTTIHYESGGLTWLACGGIAFIGCICGCCLIPFFIDGCKNAVHSCSKCNRVIGVYHRL